MEISVSNPLFYFKLFYILAFIFIFLAVLHHSLERGYRLRSVLLMLSTITLFTVIGTRLITIPFEEWINVIISKEQTNIDNRSALGGLLFGLVGLIISQRLFGFHKSILNIYAWAFPIGLGIQKLGCLINGCCFGKPSELFWAVQYPHGTQVHYSQWSSNLIDSNAAFSMSVHPVQFYETFGLILLGYLIWKTRNYWKKNLSSILFSLVMFLLFRFFMEFIRDPASSQFEVTYYFGIKKLQWLLFIIGLVLGTILFFYENYSKLDTSKNKVYTYSLRTDLLYILFISCFISVFSNIFSEYELLTVWIKFIPAVLLTLYYVLKNIEYKKYKLALSFILIIPLFVFAQTYQKDSLKVKKYKQLDIAGSFGDFYNEVLYNPHAGNCGGTVHDREYLKNAYSIGGVGYSQVYRKGFKENTFGVNLHGGNIKTTRLSTGDVESNFTYGLNPYYKYEGKWIGVGTGFQIGSLRKNKTDEVDSGELSDAIKKYNFSPEFYFRIGRPNWLDIDYNHGFLMPSAFPTVYNRVSIGSSFGLGRDYNLRYGKIFPLGSEFISAKAMISERIGMSLMYVTKGKNNNDYNYEASTKFIFGLNYRFDFKTE